MTALTYFFNHNLSIKQYSVFIGGDSCMTFVNLLCTFRIKYVSLLWRHHVLWNVMYELQHSHLINVVNVVRMSLKLCCILKLNNCLLLVKFENTASFALTPNHYFSWFHSKLAMIDKTADTNDPTQVSSGRFINNPNQLLFASFLYSF